MLRVLTLSTLYPDRTRPNFGIFVEQQTRALAAQPEVMVRVVAPVGLPPGPLARLGRYRALTMLPQREQWRGLEVYRPRFLNLPGLQGRFHAAMLARALLPVLTAIRQDFPFDVIDAEFFFPDGPAAARLARHFGVPFSIKARGFDIHHWSRLPATAGQVLAAGQAADGLLAVSEALRQDMIGCGMPGERIAVSLTGVDHRRFTILDRAGARARLGIGGPLVLSVGALIPRKGHEIVIEAMRHLPGVTLAIAGDGPERAALAAQAAALGGRVRLLGSVAHEEIPVWYAAADVMALAASAEGLANAWVESLASGTPIVITDVGGARELLDDPAAGRIAARTPEAFATAIAGLLADPPAVEVVRRSAQRFSWEATGAQVATHLARIAGLR